MSKHAYASEAMTSGQCAHSPDVAVHLNCHPGGVALVVPRAHAHLHREHKVQATLMTIG